MAVPTQFLVLGKNGRLGKALTRRYTEQGFQVTALSRAELDLAKPDQIAAVLDQHTFDVLINAAGDTDVDHCEADSAGAMLVNADGPAEAARYCAAKGAKFVQVSTDYVFSGEPHEIRTEKCEAKPINHYGESKLAGELAVSAADPKALVVRVSWLFGLEKPSFPDRIVREAQAKDIVKAVNDKWACPTYADDVADWLLALLQGGHSGLVHLCNQGACTWLEYGQEALNIATELGIQFKTHTVEGHSMHGFELFKATRPPFTALSTAYFTSLTGITPRDWKSALREYLTQKYVAQK